MCPFLDLGHFVSMLPLRVSVSVILLRLYKTQEGHYCAKGSTAVAVYEPVCASRVLSLRLCIAPRVLRPCPRKSLDESL